jgi:hypothetical protein
VQATVRSTSPFSARARRRADSDGCFRRKKVKRVAVFLPIPGSRLNSPINSSIADTAYNGN